MLLVAAPAAAAASFGWDYAQPIELHTYHPARLYHHIHYRVEYKAAWSQLLALKHVTEEQANLLRGPLLTKV